MNKHEHHTIVRKQYTSNETSLCLAIYRCVWVGVVAVAIIVACCWADRDARGMDPERTPDWGMFEEVGK